MKTTKTIPAPEALLEPWLRQLRQRGRSLRTIEAYRHAVLLAARFWREECQQPNLHKVNSRDLEAWNQRLHERRLAPITRHFYLLPVVLFYRWCERQGIIFCNPASDFSLPLVRRHLHAVLSEVEVCRLLEGVDGDTPVDLRDRALLETAYGAGLRRGELAGLHVRSIDLAEGIVTVTGKGDKDRTVPLPRLALVAIRKYLEDGRPHFAGLGNDDTALWLRAPGGQRLSKAAITLRVKMRAREAGMELTPHCLRRAFATHLLRHGASPFHLRQMLGHADFKQLRHYLRYTITDLQVSHQRSRLAL